MPAASFHGFLATRSRPKFCRRGFGYASFYTETQLQVAIASTESEKSVIQKFDSINSPGLCRDFKVISFLNDLYVLLSRSPSKGILISKIHTFYYNMNCSTEMLSISISVSLKIDLIAVLKDK